MTNPKKTPTAQSVGFDDLLEDLFGMNIRSFKTIWVLFREPRQYFTAAKTPKWMDIYTPSTRLWLGLMAILVALQFFWASPDTGLMNSMAEKLEQALGQSAANAGVNVDISQFDMRGELRKAMKLNFLIYPFIFIAVFSLLAFVYRAWGEHLPFVVRLRYVFAIIVPASVIGLISTILTPFLKTTYLPLFSLVQTIVIIGLYFMTSFRGAYGHMEIGERFGRSVVIAVCIFATLTVVQFISYGLSFGYSLFPEISAFMKTHAG